MKKVLYLPLLLIVAVVAGLFWFFENVKPVSSQISYVNFNVPAGSTATQIGSGLYKEGLIKNPTAFKVYVQFTGLSNRIQTGDYRLSPSFTLFQVADQLSRAPIEVRVTVQEGLRREEIAAKFAKSLDQNQSFIAEFLDLTEEDEGYLFPDTYSVANNATPGAIVAKMKSNFNSRVDALVPQRRDLTKSELIVLASLIERETKTGDERAVVAGILLNRLNAGWPLQVDATVQYALSSARCKSTSLNCSWWEPAAASDLGFNSPFNTYQNPGLPPSPIANPGLSAIRAAYNPAETDYFYYLHDPTGQIHYARTLEEQNANVDAYLR
jgi:UPF0755 protein